MELIDYFSLPVLAVEAFSPTGEKLGDATGVLIKAANKFFLATNYHVLSGCHAHTRKPIRDDLATPDKLVVHFRAPQGGSELLGVSPKTVKLYNSRGCPRWVESSAEPVVTSGEKITVSIDVALLPLPPGDYQGALLWGENAVYHLKPMEEIGIKLQLRR